MEVAQLKTQENKPEDSKALAELLNKQKVEYDNHQEKHKLHICVNVDTSVFSGPCGWNWTKTRFNRWMSKILRAIFICHQGKTAVQKSLLWQPQTTFIVIQITPILWHPHQDYELQLMTFRAMVDSQHKSPLKKRKMQSSSDAIQQEVILLFYFNWFVQLFPVWKTKKNSMNILLYYPHFWTVHGSQDTIHCSRHSDDTVCEVCQWNTEENWRRGGKNHFTFSVNVSGLRCDNICHRSSLCYLCMVPHSSLEHQNVAVAEYCLMKYSYVLSTRAASLNVYFWGFTLWWIASMHERSNSNVHKVVHGAAHRWW